METKNKKLLMLIEQHRHDASLRVDPLGMQLNGVVDPAVSGGIANYKVRFLFFAITCGMLLLIHMDVSY